MKIKVSCKVKKIKPDRKAAIAWIIFIILILKFIKK